MRRPHGRSAVIRRVTLHHRDLPGAKALALAVEIALRAAFRGHGWSNFAVPLAVIVPLGGAPRSEDQEGEPERQPDEERCQYSARKFISALPFKRAQAVVCSVNGV
jgi:hypothetical protein